MRPSAGAYGLLRARVVSACRSASCNSRLRARTGLFSRVLCTAFVALLLLFKLQYPFLFWRFAAVGFGGSRSLFPPSLLPSFLCLSLLPLSSPHPTSICFRLPSPHLRPDPRVKVSAEQIVAFLFSLVFVLLVRILFIGRGGRVLARLLHGDIVRLLSSSLFC